MASTGTDPDAEAQLPLSTASSPDAKEKVGGEQHPGSVGYRDIGGIAHTIPRFIVHLRIYSWAWFLMPQTTLGLSILLYSQQKTHDFAGLYVLGLIVYFVGFVQFFALFALKALQWLIILGTFKKSFSKPEEVLFSAAFWISFFGVLTGGIDYADPKILVGVMAGSLDGHVSASQIYPALLAGLFCAGAGFLYSLPLAGIYLARLFTVGLPVPDKRPGMMIAVGPPCYAPLAFLRLAASVPVGYGFFQKHELGAEVLHIMALFLSIPMFGFGCFFLIVAICAISRGARQMSFHLTWYGIVFPNVGLVTALGLIGKGIPSLPVTWVSTAGTIILVAIWLFVTACHVRAIWKGSEYLW
ncbi:hypothetical protein LTR53_011983 [Teratosphaeriaceae sp. CCFEE 6253]|nr:hypothetical protein LTR53_011983 [Teratosphaeriaceae sp. CCFEE 6253]